MINKLLYFVILFSFVLSGCIITPKKKEDNIITNISRLEKIKKNKSF
jgi:starvation-inducible outer membrane lipoprotein